MLLITICLFVAARASFAQERIFLDEQVRFVSKRNHIIYLISHLYRITSTHNNISVSRLCHALQAVVTRHKILRTALYFDAGGTIMQHCLDVNVTDKDRGPFGFSVVNFRPDDDIDETMNDILHHPDLFDLSQGRVIQCHILRRHHSGDDVLMNNTDRLIEE